MPSGWLGWYSANGWWWLCASQSLASSRMGWLHQLPRLWPSTDRAIADCFPSLPLCSGQARLVMRQKGNLRLLMNANLWAEMQVSKMEGAKVSVSPLGVWG